MNRDFVLHEFRSRLKHFDGQFCGGANVLASTLTEREGRFFGQSGGVPIQNRHLCLRFILCSKE